MLVVGKEGREGGHVLGYCEYLNTVRLYVGRIKLYLSGLPTTEHQFNCWGGHVEEALYAVDISGIGGNYGAHVL